jgi:alpha-D-xyloside xylohydrolase
MMVAPLFAGEPSRSIVLPPGGWHDFWTGEMLQSGRDLVVSASTEKIPVYVRAGSIIPWADVGSFAGAPETRRITARVYGDGSLSFAYQSGEMRLRLSWKNGSGSVDESGGGYNVYSWMHLG